MISLNKMGALLQATENTLFYAIPETDVADGYLYFNSFWLEKPTWQPVRIKEVSIADIQKTLPKAAPISLPWEPANVDTFRADFQKIQTAISNGSLKKAVPLAFEKTKQTEGLFQHCLSYLLQAKQGFIYAYWTNSHWFLGLSPEALYEWNGEILRSNAVAGTAFREKDINLMQDSKERKEHEYVIQGIRESLASFGNVIVHPTHIVEMGPLQHLRAILEVATKNLDGISCIESLHPTPAVGAYPLDKRRSYLKQLLSERPPLVFASPFGLLTDKWHKVIVAIRGLECLDQEVYVTAGCGIVKDSVLETEWKELKAKRDSIKKRLGIE